MRLGERHMQRHCYRLSFYRQTEEDRINNVEANEGLIQLFNYVLVKPKHAEWFNLSHICLLFSWMFIPSTSRHTREINGEIFGLLTPEGIVHQCQTHVTNSGAINFNALSPMDKYAKYVSSIVDAFTTFLYNNSFRIGN